MAKNFYDVLGVSKTASGDEIKKAYRKLAHQYHPDKGGGNEEKFKEVNEAYQVLSDESKRSQYDRFGDSFQNNAGAGGGFSGNPFEGMDFGGFGNGGVEFDLGDIFGDIFGMGRGRTPGRNTRGIDLEMYLTITFEEAAFGAKKTITLEKADACHVCKGSGAAPGSKMITCSDCHGSGQVKTNRRTVFGNVQSAVVCTKCDGEGKVPETVCAICNGRGVIKRSKTLEVQIPGGIDNNQRIRVQGEGEVGYKGTNPGDLYLIIQFKPHKVFVREGFNLLVDLPISFTQAALGDKVELQTLDGKIELKIPAGTQGGKVLKVANKGTEVLNSGGRRGDLLVTVRVLVPQKLSKRETELIEELAKIQGTSLKHNETLWEHIKKNW